MQFTTALALNQAQIMQQYLEDEARADKEPQTNLKTLAIWKIFVEVLKTFLAQLLGSGHVPLKYVIC
jgi:hypothetical protein